MSTLWIHAVAPFAAFRGMQAGVYRTTAPVIPPSAAHGLVLNLAGIETRDSGNHPTTLQRRDVPLLRIAVGTVVEGTVNTLYQQLHSYPVGGTGKENRGRTYGAKYHIAPIRREFIVGFDVMIGVESTDPGLRDRIRQGLAGTLDTPRYGLPFAGDNNYLFNRIDVLEEPLPVKWYTPVNPGDTGRRGSCRLTVGIDRKDSSRTTTMLMAPLKDPVNTPPESAWVWTPRPPTGAPA